MLGGGQMKHQRKCYIRFQDYCDLSISCMDKYVLTSQTSLNYEHKSTKYTQPIYYILVSSQSRAFRFLSVKTLCLG